ncbi:MAG: peptide chain release factor 2 [bacterium]|nr:peptide chain release factor 2 [bacterium]
MIDELAERHVKLMEGLRKLATTFDVEAKRREIAALEEELGRPGFWDDQARARAVTESLSRLKEAVGEWEGLRGEVDDLGLLLEVARGEGAEAAAGLAADFDRVERAFDALEVRALLGGEHDRSNAIMMIHAGAGGTESCDWVAMLLRMYRRWAEGRGYETEILDATAGEEAGLRSVTLAVKGPFAYGYLKAERGVHRLVRISPFDANKRRHTTFASADVVPEIGEEEVSIRDEDLRIDTFRAGGRGGQHVNVTDSAVRITHVPTGIVAQCQNERSQHQNKETAMRILLARLAEHERRLREEEMQRERGEKKEIAWGSQIRSYVFQPYTMVKDHRTKHEIGNVEGVMDGGIQPFIEAYLKTAKGRP